jgi:hypothetical protein
LDARLKCCEFSPGSFSFLLSSCSLLSQLRNEIEGFTPHVSLLGCCRVQDGGSILKCNLSLRSALTTSGLSSMSKGDDFLPIGTSAGSRTRGHGEWV